MIITFKIGNIIPAQFYFIPDYDEESEDTYSEEKHEEDEQVHSDDWGDSEEERGFDDDERD